MNVTEFKKGNGQKLYVNTKVETFITIFKISYLKKTVINVSIRS